MGAWRVMQEMGIEVEKLAWPADASCYTKACWDWAGVVEDQCHMAVVL